MALRLQLLSGSLKLLCAVEFERRIKRACPLKMHSGEFQGEAAVTLLLTRNRAGVEPALILTKRAKHLRHHAGEVAFPGGKWERGDSSLAATALRETWEEVDQPSNEVELIATLPRASTRQGAKVTPYVGWIESWDGLTPNPDELDEIFAVPLSYLLKDPRIRTDVFIRVLRGVKREIRVPVYEYQGFTIWGFTAGVIVDFLNRGFAAGIDTEQRRHDDRVFTV